MKKYFAWVAILSALGASSVACKSMQQTTEPEVTPPAAEAPAAPAEAPAEVPAAPEQGAAPSGE